jgi:hypothetical protein
VEARVLASITTARCVRCGHTLLEHGAEGDRPDINPSYMVCEVPGCECVDFHLCGREDCSECVAIDDPYKRLGLRTIARIDLLRLPAE